VKLIAEDIIISSSSSPLFSDIKNIHTSADDGWGYAGMQNIDIGLAPLVNCPVCPVRDGTEPKMRLSPARPRPAEPGRAGPHVKHRLSGWVSLGRAGPGWVLG